MPSSASTEGALEREIDLGATPAGLFRSLRCRGEPAVFLDPGGFEEGWGPLVALAPRALLTVPPRAVADVAAALERLDRLVAARRARGGGGGSGVIALLSYELLDDDRVDERLPRLTAIAVDDSVRALPRGRALLTTRDRAQGEIDAVLRRIERARDGGSGAALGASGRLGTSLPRERYIAAVETVLEHIRRGDIYQANLTQRFEVGFDADPLDLHEALTRATPAPRSAFVDIEGVTVASASPEVFLRADATGHVATWPIKGTRARAAAAAEDAERATALLRSEKDRAELTMIVDLERNDLGRVCRTGSIRASEPELRSFAAVHHLVAKVEGDLAPGTAPSDLIRAAFPGGSITGAPKIRAQQILRELEPVARGWYTGSLFFFADDGSIDSSILIRTSVLAGGVLTIGAGGGVVADSDPEGEWHESNDKARALLTVLGLTPEEAR